MNASPTDPAAPPEVALLSRNPLREDAVAALQRRCRIERCELPAALDGSAADRRAALNHVLVDSSAEWVLLMRDDEVISEALAESITRTVRATQPRAWGARIARELYYEGAALRFGSEAGEIRLFHKMHGRLEDAEPLPRVRLQGTVLRLDASFEATLYSTREEHVRHLRDAGVPQSFVRRLQLFSVRFVRLRAWRGGAAAMRFLWTDSAFDLGRGHSALLNP